ncbi:hypothetical protein [Streptomyces sp. TRM70350]|nr:hypothetical protein [Streptomyces sp. TRM70350]
MQELPGSMPRSLQSLLIFWAPRSYGELDLVPFSAAIQKLYATLR